MTKAAQELKSQLAALPLRDRQELFFFLWDTWEGGPSLVFSREYEQELERRVRELDDDPSIGIDGDQVFDELRKKYSRGPTDSILRRAVNSMNRLGPTKCSGQAEDYVSNRVSAKRSKTFARILG